VRRETLAATLVAGLAGAGLAGAAPLSAPTAITGPVSSVGARSATVTGTVNPAGSQSSWYVEYGTSTSYGGRTASMSAGSGTTNVDVSTGVNGLSAGTAYHYRVVASNASGTARGADGVFTTRALAPAVTTGPASEIGPFKANVSGTVDPRGLSTTWYVEYGRSTTYGAKTAPTGAGSGSSPLGVATVLSALQAGATYHYRLVATNEAGTTRGADAAFRTAPPPAVRTRGPQSVGPTSAVLVAVAHPGGRPTAVWFDYGPTTSYGARTGEQIVNGSTWQTVRAAVSGLRPDTVYHVRAVARSDAGTVAGADVAFRTSTAPVVSTGAAGSVGAATATLAGSVTPNGRTTSWWFEYGTTSSYTARTPVRNAGAGTAAVAVSEALGGLQPGTEYHFRVAASNSGGRSYGADGSFRTASPPRVVTGIVPALSTSTATLAGTVNPAGVETSWYLEWGHTTTYGFRTASQAAGAGTADVAVAGKLTGLAPATRFHYRVVAVSAAGTTVGDDRSFATAAQPRSAAGRAVACTILGTVGPDVLHGTPGRDVICGLGGDDVILAAGGADAVYGGAGFDRLLGGAGNDVLEGGAGRDELFGGAGIDQLLGMSGGDRLFGGQRGDRLVGGSGDDVLLGGTGRDRLMGGAGRDLVYARDGWRDVVDGGLGRDRGTVDRGRDRLLSKLSA
jgi:Ca2+-binding RTX toxin-like protein